MVLHIGVSYATFITSTSYCVHALQDVHNLQMDHNCTQPQLLQLNSCDVHYKRVTHMYMYTCWNTQHKYNGKLVYVHAQMVDIDTLCNIYCT